MITGWRVGILAVFPSTPSSPPQMFLQINRITPSGGDMEKGQGSQDRGLPGGEVAISMSASMDSVGLVNFGRTPVQVIMSLYIHVVYTIISIHVFTGCLHMCMHIHWSVAIFQ